ncbi:MAG: hypothetical protein M1140_14320 [Chloroflexi bacterium]|nr:hypothetical protein [Chloroflexota bacterium]
MTSKAGVTYSYTDTAHKHAVTSLSDGSSFQYDANGNMTVRIEKGVVYTQTWDVDNRLVEVVSGTQHTQYYYDADGQRVKRVTPQSTIWYVSADYAVTGSAPVQTVTVPTTYTHKLYLPVIGNGRVEYGPALAAAHPVLATRLREK